MPLAGLAAAAGSGVPLTPEQYQEMRLQREMYERNRPLSDEELDAMLPGEKEGYKVMAAPAGYKPVLDPARKLMATPTPLVGGTPMYAMPEVRRRGRRSGRGGACAGAGWVLGKAPVWACAALPS